MAWEILNDARTTVKRGREGSWVSLPARTGQGRSKAGGKYGTITLDRSITCEMRWELGDSMVFLIDRESKLFALKRDPKNGPTRLTHSSNKHSKQQAKQSKFRLSIPKETTIAIEEMFGVKSGEHVFVELEHIIDGSMVVFSKRPTNEQST